MAGFVICAQPRLQDSCAERPVSAFNADGETTPEFRAWERALGNGPCVEITVRDPAGTVSARTLSHKPTKAARQEFDRGVRELNQGRFPQAAKHFAEVVRLDPEYVEAYRRLGWAYSKTPERLPDALAAFQKAVTLAPESSTLHGDVAWALFTLNRAAEAELFARQAVRLAPSSATAHYLVAMAALAQRRLSAEIVEHLKAAAEQFPTARETLEIIRQEASSVSELNDPVAKH
jgi:tetratricopeptide (TPR) repeat protein